MDERGVGTSYLQLSWLWAQIQEPCKEPCNVGRPSRRVESQTTHPRFLAEEDSRKWTLRAQSAPRNVGTGNVCLCTHNAKTLIIIQRDGCICSRQSMHRSRGGSRRCRSLTRIGPLFGYDGRAGDCGPGPARLRDRVRQKWLSRLQHGGQFN